MLWGSNMAEMHPILWSRMSDRRLSNPDVQVHVLSTFEHRSFELADNGMVFTPQTRSGDPQLCRQLHHPNDKVNWDFVNKHTVFKKGGHRHRLRPAPDDPLQQKAKNPDSGDATPMTFDEFAKFVADYDVESVAKLSGVSKEKLEKLAQIYADPSKKVVSYWTMGFNQHTRGVWANNSATTSTC